MIDNTEQAPELGDYSNLEYLPESMRQEQEKLNHVALNLESMASKDWIGALQELKKWVVAKL